MLLSHKFFGRTDNRHPITQLLADCFDSPHDLRVGQVLAVPGEQVIEFVNRSHGDMRRVARGLRWNRTVCQNGLSQRFLYLGNIKHIELTQNRQPFLYFGRVTE